MRTCRFDPESPQNGASCCNAQQTAIAVVGCCHRVGGTDETLGEAPCQAWSKRPRGAPSSKPTESVLWPKYRQQVGREGRSLPQCH